MANEKKIDFSKPVTPAAGTWPCVVLNGIAAEETDNAGKPTGRIRARVNVVIDGGPDKGKMTTYEDEVNAKSSLYISRSLKAVGWKGSSLKTVEADIDAWVKATGGKSTVEIRHIEIKKGKKYDEWCDAWYQDHDGPPPTLYWAKANAIGRGPRPLAAPAAEALSDADEQMRRAMSEDGGAPPMDDVPHAGDSDEIPFLTISTVGLGEIAKVLK